MPGKLATAAAASCTRLSTTASANVLADGSRVPIVAAAIDPAPVPAVGHDSGSGTVEIRIEPRR